MNKFNLSKDIFFNLTNFRFSKIFSDMGYVWEVIPKIAKFIDMQFKNKEIKPNFKKGKNIYIGEGTIIQEGAVIIGPAIVGNNCLIGHGSLIRENCILGNNVNIGHAVEIKNSVFLNNAVAAHLNYIGDSIIGNNVNISGGAILANFRLDKKSVLVRIGDKKIETGLQKFGAIIGDDCNIGVNVVLNPGTILGKNTVVYPLISVTGVHKNGEIIK